MPDKISQYDSFGIDYDKLSSLSENLKSAIIIEEEKDRRHEIAQLIYTRRYKREWFTLGCISRINIYDIKNHQIKLKQQILTV